ncbi:MAG: hypothetical protein Q7J32_19265 [Sphingomonadaceae bacterium]|nr:hypothetical protein [Sphingomonadaceae bacterium]
MSNPEYRASVIATVSISRIYVALLFPIATVILYAAVLHIKGYSLADYPELIRTGELSVFRQSFLWVGLAVFFFGMYPMAFGAIRGDRRIAYVEDGQLLLACAKVKVAVADVRGVRVRSDWLGKSLVITMNHGGELVSKAPFIAERVNILEERLTRNGATIASINQV